MDQEIKDRWAINLTNAWKMASNWVMIAAGGMFAYYLSLPQNCDATAVGCLSQTLIVSHLPIPAWAVSLLVGAIGFVSRVWPTKALAPAVIQAKIDDKVIARAAATQPPTLPPKS